MPFMRLGLTAGFRRVLAVALIMLMSAAPAVASGTVHTKGEVAGTAHCHDDAPPATSSDASAETVDQHQHPSTATDSGTAQPDDCLTSCCGLACHASIAALTGTILPPAPAAGHFAPTASTGIAQRDTDRIDRPPISRL